MIEEPLGNSAGRGSAVRSGNGGEIFPVDKVRFQELPGNMVLIRLLIERTFISILSPAKELLFWISGGKIRISIGVGALAGLLVSLGFLIFDIQKGDWLLKQKYPNALSAHERSGLYAQELVNRQEYSKAEAVLREVVRTQSGTSSHADALLLLAACLDRIDKDNKSAGEEIRTLCEKFIEDYPADPRVPSAHLMIADSFAKEGKYAEADEWYRKLLRMASDDGHRSEMEFLIARNYYQAGRLSDAADGFERMRQRYQGSAVAMDSMLMLGKIFAESGKQEDASRMLDEVIAEAPGTAHAATALNIQAKNALKAGDYEGAVQYCTRWLKESPMMRQKTDIMLTLGRAKLKMGMPQEALTVASNLIDDSSDSAGSVGGLILRGEALEHLGRSDEAESTYAEAVRSFPQTPAPYESLARLYSLTGDIPAAIAQMELACSVATPDDTALIELSRLYRLNGENVKALDILENFTHERRLSVHIREVFLTMADIYMQLGRQGDAYETLTRLGAAVTRSADESMVYEKLGDMLAEVGLYDDAIANYRIATKSGINVGNLKRKIAENLLESGKTSDCLGELDSVNYAALSPDERGRLLGLKARALMQLKMYDDAGLTLKQAMPPNGAKEDISLLALLMQVSLKSNDDATASGIYERTLKLITGDKGEIPPEARSIILCWAGHLYEKEEYKRAAEAYSLINKSSSPVTDAAWALYQMGNCYYYMLDYDKAGEAYSRLISEYNGSEWVKYALQKEKLIALVAGT